MQSTILLISILSTLTSSTPLNVIPRQELGSAPGSTPPNTGNANGLPSISPISIQNNAIACQPLSGIPSNFGQLCIAAAQAAESFANNALSTAGPGAVPIPLTAPSSSADGVACAISITQSGSTGMFDTDGQSVTDILNQLVSDFSVL